MLCRNPLFAFRLLWRSIRFNSTPVVHVYARLLKESQTLSTTPRVLGGLLSSVGHDGGPRARILRARPGAVAHEIPQERLSMSTSTLSRSTPTSPPRLPSLTRLSALALLVITLTVLSISFYWLEHHKARHATVLGDTTNPDHATVTVLIKNIDPTAARIRGQLELKGPGSLVDALTHDLKEDATLVGNRVTNPAVVSKANVRPEFVSV